MLRIAVISIAWVLAAEPSMTVLCRAWCDFTAEQTGAADDCHLNAGPAASARLAGSAECERPVLAAGGFVREDIWRIVGHAGDAAFGANGRPLIQRPLRDATVVVASWPPTTPAPRIPLRI